MHFAWEHLQMPLFEGMPDALGQQLKMCLFATATGDMLFMLTLYLTVAVIHKSLWWPSERLVYSQPATWVVPVLVGVLLAVSFELWAVHVADRWQYGSMPLAPIVHVGLTPVLQMAVIPVAVTGVCRWAASRYSRQTR